MNKMLVVINLLGAISTAVTEIEARSIEAKQAGEEVFTGEFKRELAIALIRSVYERTNPTIPFEQLASIVRSTINTVVAFKNAIGEFKKSK